MVNSFDGLEFDSDKHIYRLMSHEVPSVTTVMKPLTDDIYGQIDPKVLDMAAYRGTTVHNSIENHIKFGIDDIPEEFRGYFEAFLNWSADHSVKSSWSELRVYHKALRYAGTIDMLASVNNVSTLVDFKTTSSVQKELCRVQLEAYNQCLKSFNCEEYKSKIIVHLHKDGSYDVIEYPINDVESWKVFTALLTIRNYKVKMNKGE